MRYNTLSRLSPAPAMRMRAIPAVRFYGDFGFPIDRDVVLEWLWDFKSMGELVGDGRKLGKQTSGDNDTLYLGMRCISSFPY